MAQGCRHHALYTNQALRCWSSGVRQGWSPSISQQLPADVAAAGERAACPGRIVSVAVGGPCQAVHQILGARPLVGLVLQAVAHQLPLLVRAVVRHPAQQRCTLTQVTESKKDNADGQSLLRLRSKGQA